MVDRMDRSPPQDADFRSPDKAEEKPTESDADAPKKVRLEDILVHDPEAAARIIWNFVDGMEADRNERLRASNLHGS